MLAALALSLVALVAPDEAAKNELLSAAKKLESIQSYHFEHVMVGSGRAAKEGGGDAASGEAEGGEAAGGEGETAKVRRDGDPWQVDFQRGKPVRLVRRDVELYRSEKKLATLDPKSKQWTSVARGGAPAAGEAGAKGSAALVRVSAEVERLLFPHVLMKELGKKVREVSKAEADGSVTFVATLDPEVARDWAGLQGERPARREGGRREGGKREGGKREGGNREGGEGGDEGGEGETPKAGGAAAGGERVARNVECEGKLTVVSSKGQITSLDIEVTVKGQQPRVLRRTMKLTAIDATAVAPPAEAIAVLDIQ
ncbi:MAG: hypothetical protein JNL90_10300 [Planctomycetes bacterium]|nr:hypothetical protein [Planctomycetota bacterium]